MTRKEAIKQLQYCKGLIKQNGQVYLDERDFPLLNMAIEALSDDSVSRRDTVTLNSPISIQAEMVAVVRCKDCKHRETDDCPMYRIEWFSIDEGYGDFEEDYIIHDYTTDNGYCHYGERK